MLGRVGLDILAAELLIAVELEERGVGFRHPLRRQHILIAVRAGEIVRDRIGRIRVNREGQTLGRLPVIEAVTEALRIIVVRNVFRGNRIARIADEVGHRGGVILGRTHADVRVEHDLDLARIPLRIGHETGVGAHRLRPDNLLLERLIVEIPAAEGVTDLGGRRRGVDGIADVVVHIRDLRAAVALEDDLAVDVSVLRVDRHITVAELEGDRERDRRGQIGLEVTGEDVTGHHRIVRRTLEVNRLARVRRDGTEVRVDARARAGLIQADLDRRDLPLTVDRHRLGAGHGVVTVVIHGKRLRQVAVGIPAGEGVMRLGAGVDRGGGGVRRIRVDLIGAVELDRDRPSVIIIIVGVGVERNALRIVVEGEIGIAHDRAGLHRVGGNDVVAFHTLQAVGRNVIAVIHREGLVIRHLVGRTGLIVVDRDGVRRHIIGQRAVGGGQRGDRAVDFRLGGIRLLLDLHCSLERRDEGVVERHVGGVTRVGVRVRERALRVAAGHVIGRVVVGLCLTGRNAGQEGSQLGLVVDLEFHGLEPAALQRAARLELDTEGPLRVTGARRAGTGEQQVEVLTGGVQSGRAAARGVRPLRAGSCRAGAGLRLRFV